MFKKKLTKIEGDFNWQEKKWEGVDMSKVKDITGFADLRGYQGDLLNLKSIGYSAYLQGYEKDLPSMPDDFNRVYIEYENNTITMKEYRERRGFTKKKNKRTIELKGFYPR